MAISTLSHLRSALKNQNIQIRLFRRDRHRACPPFLYGEKQFTYKQLFPISRMPGAVDSPLSDGSKLDEGAAGLEIEDVPRGGVACS